MNFCCASMASDTLRASTAVPATRPPETIGAVA